MIYKGKIIKSNNLNLEAIFNDPYEHISPRGNQGVIVVIVRCVQHIVFILRLRAEHVEATWLVLKVEGEVLSRRHG